MYKQTFLKLDNVVSGMLVQISLNISFGTNLDLSRWGRSPRHSQTITPPPQAGMFMLALQVVPDGWKRCGTQVAPGARLGAFSRAGG